MLAPAPRLGLGDLSRSLPGRGRPAVDDSDRRLAGGFRVGYWRPGRQVANAKPWRTLLLAGLLAAAGVTHFVLPDFYDRIVPHALPGSRRSWTVLSGVVELTCAVALIPRRSRRLAATCTAVLFVLVLPANVQMAVDWRHRAALDQLVAYGRLPLQVPLIWWALEVRRRMPVGRQPAATGH